ncbi:MAG: carbohydrate-binding domain-containing protein [Micropruina sp.]|nr:carbohydrate-binding domain-containing protein [Micropruina sp.]
MNFMNATKTWLAGGLATVVLAVGGCTAATVAATTSTSTSTGTSTSATVALTADHDDTADHTWDTSTEVTIDLSNPTATDGVTVKDGVITISAAGAYRLSGTLADGQVVVDTEDAGSVHLILDNASITNNDGSAIVIDKAELALIVLAKGTTNTVTDGATYAATGDDDPNSAIWSDSDLTILGEGTLNVTGNYNDAINGSDGVVIVSGTINATAKDDGIRGKDYLVIKGGTLAVTSSAGDTLKSDNEEDSGLGYVSIVDGTVALTSADDGIDAWSAISITGGSTTVASSVEGLEAKTISISGGTTTVTASDDGINATDSASTAGDMEAQDGTILSISGGELTVTADGDGLDSNGDIAMSGGTVVVNGPTNNGNAALDYNGTFLITGGSLMAGGSAGMAQAPGTESSQKSLMISVNAAAGSTIEVKDSSGTVIATFKPTRQTGSLVVSNDKVKEGETYTVYVDGATSGTTDTSQVTNGGGMGGGGGRGGGGRPDDQTTP